MEDKNPQNHINDMKKNIIRAAFEAKEGHIASSFSILDILWVLYFGVMKNTLPSEKRLSQDRFILSKGHASLALYAILTKKNIIPQSYMDNFCKFDGLLGGHPDCQKIPEIEASTGSLGHGLPMAVGMALGSKISNIKNRIFCLIGDGEANEGSIWEAVLLAAHHNLENLCCIVDFNHSTDRALMLSNLEGKFEQFGWKAMTIDGHNHEALYKALSTLNSKKPLVVICNTIKGYGIKQMENAPEWHHRAPNKQEMIDFIEQLA